MRAVSSGVSFTSLRRDTFQARRDVVTMTELEVTARLNFATFYVIEHLEVSKCFRSFVVYKLSDHGRYEKEIFSY